MFSNPLNVYVCYYRGKKALGINSLHLTAYFTQVFAVAGASGSLGIQAVLSASVQYSFFGFANAEAPIGANVQLGVGIDVAAGLNSIDANNKFKEQQEGTAIVFIHMNR